MGADSYSLAFFLFQKLARVVEDYTSKEVLRGQCHNAERTCWVVRGPPTLYSIVADIMSLWAIVAEIDDISSDVRGTRFLLPPISENHPPPTIIHVVAGVGSRERHWTLLLLIIVGNRSRSAFLSSWMD